MFKYFFGDGICLFILTGFKRYAAQKLNHLFQLSQTEITVYISGGHFFSVAIACFPNSDCIEAVMKIMELT